MSCQTNATLKYVERTVLKYAYALQSCMIPQADDVEELNIR